MPTKLDFDSQPVSTASQPKAITLTNKGPSPLGISDVYASGIDFLPNNRCGTTLAPGASCTVEITFKPAITGPRIGSLIIADDDPASPHRIALAGIGR